MTVVNMSVHRGLSELKLYTNKIETSLNTTFVVANKASNKMIGGQTVDELTSAIKGSFDKVVDLIENRKRIKDAIVKSNAVTKVKINGVEMTVAEAIERKASIDFDKDFLNTLQRQFIQQNGIVDNNNNQLPAKLETFLAATLGDKRDVETVKALTLTFDTNNKYFLIDPAKIQTYIAKLTNDIQEFESQVDYILSESNAVTFLDVDLVV
jgi:hypothetical protein